VQLLGWQPREALRDIFDRHGLFLFPSFTEGFGKVFLEAMARGLAVVATDQGGARDLLRSGHTGFLAPVGDVAALAASVRRLRADPELIARIGAEARRTAERHTWRDSVEKLVEFSCRRLAAKASL
jgi:glycosyltransferase involved in cell wall biosynthesis